MNGLKNKILESIFEKYQQWIENETFHCHRGCSLCCTQNVMITAVEGQHIYNYIVQQKKETWFAGKLLHKRQAQYVKLTTNDFARLCLEKNTEYGEVEQPQQNGICPFLEENCCNIYAVRPFICRSFASTRDCHDYGSACLDERLLVINTVTMQLIEHLGQKGYWGNMLDVLLALANHKANGGVKKYISDDEMINSAISNTLTAEPIPGFLLKPEEENEVNLYLQTVLSAKIGLKTIEEIFNNK
ncbi:MAG: YkgJ family cysteine cluster protein [Proteobacteria bacterium]|nr:YkgJ family cysteine cluster protein [Pseudomonadota bacterium]MBU4297896.1 YkgJ family cysteine cluster protein [Pseudomonadota bacterium]MCG2746016.1 YkgJ family cysteine cluster protein [Desulfobulbaceae bacterium]